MRHQSVLRHFRWRWRGGREKVAGTGADTRLNARTRAVVAIAVNAYQQVSTNINKQAVDLRRAACTSQHRHIVKLLHWIACALWLCRSYICGAEQTKKKMKKGKK
jgi:hypothetical protein